MTCWDPCGVKARGRLSKKEVIHIPQESHKPVCNMDKLLCPNILECRKFINYYYF